MINRSRKYGRISGVISALAASLFLAACGGGGGIDNELAFRVIQASPDAPPVNIRIDGVAFRSGVNYKEGTGFTFVTPRDYHFQVEAIVPGDDEIVVDQNVPLAAGKEYTVLAVGKAATASVQSLIFENAFEDIPDGNTRVQFVHVAPDAPTYDVYITGKDASLPAATPLGQVSYGDQPAARELIPPGTYVIRVTPAGDPDTVVFDSGELGGFRNRDDLLIVLVQNTTTGTAPISLVVNDRFNNLEILDKSTPTSYRVVHLSPDAPALDVVADPSTAATPEVTLASGLTYLGHTGHVSIPPETYTVRGVKTSDPTPATPLFTFTRASFAAQSATVFATGLLATMNGQVVADDLRPIFAQAKLRVLDAAPGSGTVDLYLLEPGQTVADVNPTITNFVLTSITGHLGFAPNSYTVVFTQAGTKTELAGQAVVAGAGTVQTVILVDAVRVDETSDGKPPSVLVLDDLGS
ncbi:MAG: DUF4397 domain-containing protein [Gammaproteobacteria bacterium]